MSQLAQDPQNAERAPPTHLSASGENHYRAEVDSLRAIAVAAVILYHADVPWIPGGYLGVDIFFVISGYLITRILRSEIAAQSFSLRSFYERRVRRLLPALAITCLLCIPAALALMLPNDLENFGQSLVATQLFANNVLLFLTSDYFALASEFKPLVHTWSLGVEEQYYFIAPVMIALATKLGGPRVLFGLIVGVTTASFAFCVWASGHEPEANFYLLFSRAWELGAGTLVALGEPKSGRYQFSSLPLAMGICIAAMLALATSFLLFTEHTPSPGPITLIPIIATCGYLISANTWGNVLTWQPLVKLGLISYSAYLFHQPVFAFVKIGSLERPSTLLLVALIPLVLALAYASWRFVELPFRKRDKVSFRNVAIFSVAAGVLMIAFGLTLHFTSGFRSAWTELADDSNWIGAQQNGRYNTSVNAYLSQPLPSSNSNPRVLVVGDSFARDFVNMGLASGHLRDNPISYSNLSHCEPTLPSQLTSNIRNADVIILASDFAGNALGCVETRLHQFRSLTSARIIVAGIKNFGWNNNAIMRLGRAERYVYRARILDEVTALNDRARARFGADYLDILQIISDDDGRVPVFTPEHRLISQDTLHLTPAGAEYLGRLVYSRDPTLAGL